MSNRKLRAQVTGKRYSTSAFGIAMSRVSTLSFAPPFTLPTDRGEMVALEALLAKGPLLLAFHRGTW